MNIKEAFLRKKVARNYQEIGRGGQMPNGVLTEDA